MHLPIKLAPKHGNVCSTFTDTTTTNRSAQERVLFKKYIFLDSPMETHVISLQKLCPKKKKKKGIELELDGEQDNYVN